MKLTGNTIFITGGGSGIGRGLAEAFHKLGNKVIISGRRRANLDEVVAANPGMAAIKLDITDPASITDVANRLIGDHLGLNVLINNAGIMLSDRVAGPINDQLMVDTVNTNLLGPIRMTSALVEHLKAKDEAVIAYVSSVLGFVPMAVTAVYSATKAALHSYALSQRFLLKDSGVRVLEIAPPWVRTDLMNSREARRPCRSTSSSQRQWQCSARTLKRSSSRARKLSGPTSVRTSMASSAASTSLHPRVSRAVEPSRQPPSAWQRGQSSATETRRCCHGMS